MSEWKQRNIERRDFRHIHHEEREFFPKASKRRWRKRARCNHDYVEHKGGFWTSHACKHCGKKYTIHNWDRLNTRTYRKEAASPDITDYIYYGRNHHGKYKINREHLVQRRGF